MAISLRLAASNFLIGFVFVIRASSDLSATRNCRLFHGRGADAAQFIRF
jgi:hypothetical protein